MMGTLFAAGLIVGTHLGAGVSEDTTSSLFLVDAMERASSPLCDTGHGEWLGGTLQIDAPTEDANATRDQGKGEQEGQVPCWFV